MNNWELSKKVYKRLGFSDRPVLGWTIIGLVAVIIVNILAGGWDGIQTVTDWVSENNALISIVLLAVCIGIGSHRGLRKTTIDQQEKIENLGIEINDQRKKIRDLSNENS